jgi:hypothetical protein
MTKPLKISLLLFVAIVTCVSASWLCGEATDNKPEVTPAQVVDKLLSFPADQVLLWPCVEAAPLVKLLDDNPAAYAPALASHLSVPSGKSLSEKELSDSGVCAGLLARGGTKQAHDALGKYGSDLFKVMTDTTQEEAVSKSAREIFYGVLRLLGDMRDASLAESAVSIFAGEPLQDRYKIYRYLTVTARGDAKVLASLKQLYEDEKSPLHADEMLGHLIAAVSATDAFSWLPMTFLSKNDQEAKQGYSTFSAQYREAVDTLIAIVRNEGLRETNPLAVRRAIFALGEVRAEKAIPALMRLMDWTPQPGVNDTVNALVAIGKPSANAMLELLASNPPADISSPVAVLRGVEGDDVALFRLTKAMEAEKDATRKKNLTAAVDFLTKMIKEEQPATPPATSDPVPPSDTSENP